MANEWISRLRVRKAAKIAEDPPPATIKPKTTGVRKVSRKVSKAVAKRVASLSPKKRAVSAAVERAVEHVPEVPKLLAYIVGGEKGVTREREQLLDAPGPERSVETLPDAPGPGKSVETLPDASGNERSVESIPTKGISDANGGLATTRSKADDHVSSAPEESKAPDPVPSEKPRSERVFMHQYPVFDASSILEAIPEAPARNDTPITDLPPHETPSKTADTQEDVISDLGPDTPVPSDPAIDALFEESPFLPATVESPLIDDISTHEFALTDIEILDDDTLPPSEGAFALADIEVLDDDLSLLSEGAASLIESIAQDSVAVHQVSELDDARAKALQREWLVWPPYERAEEIPEKRVSQYKEHFQRLAGEGFSVATSLDGKPPRFYDSTLELTHTYNGSEPQMLAWRAMYRIKTADPKSGRLLLQCITPGWEGDHAGGVEVWIDPKTLRLPIDAPSGDAQALWDGHQRVDLGWRVFNASDGTWGKRDGSGDSEDLPLLPDQWPEQNRDEPPASVRSPPMKSQPLLSPRLGLAHNDGEKGCKLPTTGLMLPGIKYHIPPQSQTERVV